MTRLDLRVGRGLPLRGPVVLIATLSAMMSACGGDGGSTSGDAVADSVAPDVADPGGIDAWTAEVPADPGQMDTGSTDTGPVDTIQKETTIPGGCCGSDGDCEAGSRCIGLSMDPLGVCVPVPAAGACYERVDCKEDQACQGAHVTICVMSSLPSAGTCVDMPDHCCYEDVDCEAGHTCEGASDATWGPGECRPAPDPGRCWRDEQCADGLQCLGATPCGCLVDCYWAGPGYCTPIDGTCCFMDGDCAEGLHCVGGQIGGNVGHCKPPLTDGTCWGNEDCVGPTTCEGAQICPCDADCDMEDQPGNCVPATENCCFTDTQCPAGQICAGGGPGGYPGACKTPDPEGGCWRNADCPVNGQICLGEQICPCDTPCEVPDEPGVCTMGEDLDCCFDAQDCSPGFVCVPEHSETTFGVCKPMSRGDGCWFDSDCVAEETCEGVYICPCDADCDQADTMGICV